MENKELSEKMSVIDLVKMYNYYESGEEAKKNLADAIADKYIKVYLEHLKYKEKIKNIEKAENFLICTKKMLENRHKTTEVLDYFIKRFLNFKKLKKEYTNNAEKKEREKIKRELQNRKLWRF